MVCEERDSSGNVWSVKSLRTRTKSVQLDFETQGLKDEVQWEEVQWCYEILWRFVETRKGMGIWVSEFKMLYLEISLNILLLYWLRGGHWGNNVPEELNTNTRGYHLTTGDRAALEWKFFRIVFPRRIDHPKEFSPQLASPHQFLIWEWSPFFFFFFFLRIGFQATSSLKNILPLSLQTSHHS